MSHNLYVTFEGMRNGELDRRIDRICDGVGAERGDSGTWMIPPYASEEEFKVPNDGVTRFVAEFRELGLKDLSIQDEDEFELGDGSELCG
jgi:hypothetical protein